MSDCHLFKVVFLDNEEDAYHYQELQKRSKYYRVADPKVMLEILKTDYKYVDVLDVKVVGTININRVTQIKKLLKAFEENK